MTFDLDPGSNSSSWFTEAWALRTHLFPDASLLLPQISGLRTLTFCLSALGLLKAVFFPASRVDLEVTIQEWLVNTCGTCSGLLENKLLNLYRVSITGQGHTQTEVQLSEPVKVSSHEGLLTSVRVTQSQPQHLSMSDGSCTLKP